MSSPALPDLSGLVALAREQSLDLRPILLRVQTDLFVAAPSRNSEAFAAFEALALGFLPVVSDETAGIVARKLAPLADAPPRVVEALLARGGEARRAVIELLPHLSHAAAAKALADEPDLAPVLAARSDLGTAMLTELLGRGEDAVDMALARNVAASLGRALHGLVDRGRGRARLAAALLARPDLSVSDEAVLYVHADAQRRAQIRERLRNHAPLATSFGSSAPRADTAIRADLLAHAARGDAAGFRAVLAGALGVAPALEAAWAFEAEAGRELVSLALLAVGLASEDVIRTFLMLDREIACSVEAVFHLAHIARTTPRAIALYVTEATLDVAVGRALVRHLPLLNAGLANPDRGGQPASRLAPTRPASTPYRRDLKTGQGAVKA